MLLQAKTLKSNGMGDVKVAKSKVTLATQEEEAKEVSAKQKKKVRLRKTLQKDLLV